MPRIAYVDGRYGYLADAQVSVEDRGYQFADGIYEVCAVLNGQLLDWLPHLERLNRSLSELAIDPPMGNSALTLVARRLLRLNRACDALLYIQVTRGTARRDHPFPARTPPTLVMTVRPFNFAQRVPQQVKGVKVITRPDERWARRDIKSISLLPNVLAKQAAKAAGAFEAWLIESDGRVTEGGSTNAWIVNAAGTIITRDTGPDILAGVMRATLIGLARADGLRVEERAFTLAEAMDASEAFLTSTTAPCLAVVAIDGTPVANGKPGPVTRRLGALMWAEIERQTGWKTG